MRSAIKPLKSLGQHFLNSREIAEQIVNSLSQGKDYNQILEIGPGTGVLTSLLLKIPSFNLFVIEIDDRSVSYLKEQFPALKNRIIHDDFLTSPLRSMGSEPFAIIGNFPYNISSQILFRVLETYTQIPELIGMFQKEVAQRIASGPGSRQYGILSVLLQAHYDIEYLFTVPADVFIPPPKIQSGVIRMRLKKDHQLSCDPSAFKTLVKTAFNQRRKTLRNSIRQLIPEGCKELPYLHLRPEQLHYTQFEELTCLISAYHGTGI